MARGNDPRNKSDYGAQVEAELQPRPQPQMMPVDMASGIMQRDLMDPAVLAGGGGAQPVEESTKNVLDFGMGPAGSRLTNQDFNPAGYKPNESRSTQVGKYGGSPLYAVSIGMPFSVIDDRLNAHAIEENELRKAAEDFDPRAGVKDLNAIKYRDDYGNWVNDQIEQYKANVFAAYGEKEGLRRLRTKSSPEAAGLWRLVQHINTVNSSIDDAVTNANALEVGMRGGELQYNPAKLAGAKEVKDRLGSFSETQDPEELARILPRFNANVSLIDQLKKDGIHQMWAVNGGNVKKVYEQVKAGDPLYMRGFRTLLGREVHSYDQMIDALADQYAPQYAEDGLSRDEVRAAIAAELPNTYTEDVKSDQINTGGGGGSGTRTRGTGAVEMIVVPKGAVDATGKELGKSVDAQGNEIQRPSMSLMRFSNNQGGLAAVDVFKQGQSRIDMIPTELVNVDDTLMIVGKGYGLPRAQMIKKARAAGATAADIALLQAALGRKDAGTSTSEDDDTIQRFFQLQDVMIPAKGNWARLVNSFGVDEATANQQLGIGVKAAPPVAAPPAAEPSAAGPAAGSVFYDDPNSPPPIAGAQFDHGSNAWVVKNPNGPGWKKLRR